MPQRLPAEAARRRYCMYLRLRILRDDITRFDVFVDYLSPASVREIRYIDMHLRVFNVFPFVFESYAERWSKIDAWEVFFFMIFFFLS